MGGVKNQHIDYLEDKDFGEAVQADLAEQSKFFQERQQQQQGAVFQVNRIAKEISMEPEVKGSGLKAPWQCPACHDMTSDFPALSRRDNMTEICSDCGTQEAVNDFLRSREDA